MNFSLRRQWARLGCPKPAGAVLPVLPLADELEAGSFDSTVEWLAEDGYNFLVTYYQTFHFSGN